MFEFIHGILKDKEPTRAVIEANQIGYRLAIPLNTYTKLPSIGQNIFLYLSQVIREDSNTLYAFLEKQERDLFETLITISGIGPKTGLAIIGHMDWNSFHHAITASDIRILSKIPGIGKKSAERLIMEMKDKLKSNPSMKKNSFTESSGVGSLLTDAVSTLMNLGYHPVDAQKAVQAAQSETKDILDLGTLITLALNKIR